MSSRVYVCTNIQTQKKLKIALYRTFRFYIPHMATAIAFILYILVLSSSRTVLLEFKRKKIPKQASCKYGGCLEEGHREGKRKKPSLCSRVSQSTY